MKNTLPINLPTKMLKFVCVWICAFVFQCLYMRETPLVKAVIHISRGHLLLPGSLMCLSLQNVCGAQMGTSGQISNYSLQKGAGRGRCCMSKVCNNTQNLQVCKLCFLENIMESQKIWFKHKSHPSIFLPTKCFYNKPLKNRVLRLLTDNINHQSSRTESCVVCRLRS